MVITENVKLRDKILERIEELEVIDAHEHLAPEEERIKEKLDVFSLFSHYTKGDLFRAGMSEEQYQLLFNYDTALEERWKIFSPFWDKIRYTCYSRSVLYTVKKFYNYDDINEGNYQDLSAGIAERNKPGIYRKVLRDACHIKVALTQCARTDVDPDREDPVLVPVMPLIHLATEISWEELSHSEGWSKYVSLPIQSLDDYIEAERVYLRKIKEEGAVGVKARAYPHLYPFGEPDKGEAEELFSDLKNGKIEKTHRVNALYYYILDMAISLAIQEGFVIAVHTGYWGDFRDLSPLHLIPFLQKYPEGKFDVYHMGYPWLRETLMLAKEFSNVYLNFCWLHVISQKAAFRAMSEVIETIPVNKVIGFGGDYSPRALEKVYGHLTMAKEDIAEVIAERITKGWMDFDGGIEIIKNWFYDNPANLYSLTFKESKG